MLKWCFNGCMNLIRASLDADLRAIWSEVISTHRVLLMLLLLLLTYFRELRDTSVRYAKLIRGVH